MRDSKILRLFKADDEDLRKLQNEVEKIHILWRFPAGISSLKKDSRGEIIAIIRQDDLLLKIEKYREENLPGMRNKYIAVRCDSIELGRIR